MEVFRHLFFAFVVFLATVTLNVWAYQCDVPDDWIFSNVTTRNFGRGSRWPNGVVKYELHRSLSVDDRRVVQSAFSDIQSKTCIRFQTKSPGEKSYTSIEADNNVCGLAHMCRTGRRQFAKFGGRCRDMNTMVHELGHNLCLGHEHSRRDRDEHLGFNGCHRNRIPGRDTNFDLRGSLYDFASQMHYFCGSCVGGFPKPREVARCGPQVQDGLSVMDADKLNDLYNCGGCHSHRWRPINRLNAQDRQNLVRFGRADNGDPWYACRGVISGELCIGKYSSSSGICHLPYGGGEHQLRRNAQVFTNPSGGSSNRVVNIREYREGRASGRPVRSGRTRDRGEGSTGYIAVADIERGGSREQAVGKVFERNLNLAYFPVGGAELQVRNDFGIVVCG